VGYCLLESDDYEDVNSVTSEVINVLDSSHGGISRGLYIGTVRGSGNNVRTALLITPFTLSA
jgi:hypothetical protein